MFNFIVKSNAEINCSFISLSIYYYCYYSLILTHLIIEIIEIMEKNLILK
jgi:hypothetical protein